MDFIGIQKLHAEIVTHSYFTPLLQAKIIKANARDVERTLMNWEIYPESIYHMLKQFDKYENIREIIVTENGAAFHDHLENGGVVDIQRREYLQQYLHQVLRAKNEGVKVNGYFIWTFTDNFEWAEGYHPRFGIVHVDFATQKRTVKSSGHWYSQFLGIKENMILKSNSRLLFN